MQKKFKIEVDCANCAAKIETAIKALPGVRMPASASWPRSCCWRPTTTSSTPC